MTKRVLLLVVWVIAACLLGCGGGGTAALPISSWTLVAAGSDATRPVSLPQHLDELLPQGPSRYSLRTSVAVPPEWRGRWLTFAIPHLRARAWLNVNGHEMAPLDTSLIERYRGSGHPRWRIPAELTSSDELSIELVVERQWTQAAWLDTVPRISATMQGDGGYLFVRTWNDVSALFAFTTALFVFFAYAIIFLLDRRRSAHGWFALQAFASCVYPSFELGLLQPVFSVHDGAVSLVMVVLFTVAGVHFTRAEFEPGPTPKWALASFALALVTAVVFRDPFQLTRYAAPFAALVVSLNVAYQVNVLRRALRKGDKRRGAILLCFSWVALAVTAFVDMAAWAGFGELYLGIRTACVGITVIALAQSAELSIQHISSLQRADKLNAELAERLELLSAKHREVEILNEELRFQVTSRSEQLALALSKVGAPHGRIRPLEPGEIIEARYRVIRQVGEGAMGAVYEVERVSDKRRLALKMLTDVSGGLNVARFAREAQIVSQINHPNVIAIVDVDVSSSGFFYMVMEFIAGLSLRQQQERHLGDVRWSVPVLRQVAEGLAAIHARGVVHRDLKPGNILVTATEKSGEPLVKIADFGISSLESAADEEAAYKTADSPGTPSNGSSNGKPAGSLDGHVGSDVEPIPPSLRSAAQQSLPEGLPPSLRDVLQPVSQGETKPQSLPEGMPPSLRNILASPGPVDSRPQNGPSTSAPATSAPATTPAATNASLRSEPITSNSITSTPVTSAPVTRAPVTSAPATPAAGRRMLPPPPMPAASPPASVSPVTPASPTASPAIATPRQAAASPPLAASPPPPAAAPDPYDDAPPRSLRDPSLIPKSIADIVPPPSQRAIADKLMERFTDTWDTNPGAQRNSPVSLRGGAASMRGAPASMRGAPASLPPPRASLPPMDAPLTQTGALMGTPIYMAPELASGVKFAKPSADVFSLGVIAYELLTGKAPFPEPPALMRLAGRTPPAPEPILAACPKLAPSVAAILGRCLALDPSERPTARELADTLGEAIKLCA